MADETSVRFPKGYYRGRATGAVLDHTKEGKPCIVVDFEVLEEGYEGQHIPWYGYFTDASVDRTMDSLRYCGWNGDDLSVFAGDQPVMVEGLNSQEVSLDIAVETYEGKTRSKVQWVN